ncbi:MAG TPA: tol-pal system protein YbgF, partial [Kofleriaceae bacterium]|nr:tol-pal system protein YbgF [Kofleriaceae bacterium]
YRRGLDALKSHEYDAAITALREVVASYPQHELADNAQYWLGEAYYDQKDYGRALAEFRATVTVFPRGNKVPDALLKVGFAYLALGDSAKAKAALGQVVTLYPGTAPATLAAARLETLP